MEPPKVLQNSLDPAKWAMLNSHSFADLAKRPGLAWKLGSNQGLNGCDFSFVYRLWISAVANDADDARRRKNGEPTGYVDSAEQVPWEKRNLSLFDAIRPAPPARIKREKLLVALAVQARGNFLFVCCPNL
jgi:hypothetical protein